MAAARQRRGMDDLEMWRRLALLVSRVEESVEKSLQREHDLSLSEFRALLALSEAEHGSLRMQSLAEAIGLNQSSISRLIVRLQRAGLVERRVCEDDRRGVFGRITESGRDLVKQVLPICRAELGLALDNASFDTATAPIVTRLRYTSAEGAA